MNPDSIKFKNTFLANPKKVREAILSDYQINILKYIRNFNIHTSSQLSLVISNSQINGKMSVQSASNSLFRLYRAGYLDRRIQYQNSGGVELYYTIRKGIKL